jgi:hypothetical protein
MRKWAVLAMLVALSPVGAAAQPLPSDHLIVPGVRIGAAELEQADQGALFRALGEPNQTKQRGDRAYYMYGAPEPDELVVELDLTKDEPREISTSSAAYRTREGLGVGSAGAAVRAALGPPVCQGGDIKSGDAKGDGLMVYGSIWFLISHGTVTRVSIRKHLNEADFQTGSVHC